MRVTQLGKLLHIVDMINTPGGATARQIAEELGITRRAVTNWIGLLEDLNFPLYEEPAPFSAEIVWKLEPGYARKLPNLTVPNLTLEFPEILSLCLLRGQASLLEGSQFETVLNRAFHKLESFFPQESCAHLKRLQNLFVCCDGFNKDYSGKEDIIETLTLSVVMRETLSVSYFSFSKDRTVSFRIDPLQFFESRGGLYVFYRSPDHGDIRILAVERIEALERSGEKFDWPEDFNGRRRLEAAFEITCDEEVLVRIRVSRDQAKYVKERKIFTRQKIEENTDGSLIVELHTSGWADIKRWVLSMGSGAEIIGPPELRDRLEKELRETLALYGHPSQGETVSALPGKRGERGI